MKVKAFNSIQLAVTVASCTLIPFLPVCASNYSVTDLGTLGGDYSCARDLNNGVQIVGVARTAEGHEHAFIWAKGVMTDLGTLGGTNSHAEAINAAGTVVGWAKTSDGRTRACLFGASTNTDLSGSHPDDSFAAGVNDLGQAVGWTEIPVAGADQPRPTAVYFGPNNTLVHILSLWSGTPIKGRANAINNNNVVAGWTGDVFWFWGPHDRAQVWHSLNAYDFSRSGAIDSHMLGMNEAGEIVGESGYGYVAQRATLWSGTNQFNLGSLTFGSSSANDINTAGQIVGSSAAYRFGLITNLPISLPGFPPPEQKVYEGYIPTRHAFLWQDGVMVDLNNLIPTNSGWELKEATAINDAGHIVGSGTLNGQTRAFLLAPRAGPNEMPFVRVISPSDGEWVSGTNVTLQAEAHDADGEIRHVEFFAYRVAKRDLLTGGISINFLQFPIASARPPGYLGTVTNAPYLLDVTNLAGGNYLIVAKATDDQNVTAVSPEVLLRFNAPMFLGISRGSSIIANPPSTPDRRLTLQFSANEEALCDIEASTDLVHWTKSDLSENPFLSSVSSRTFIVPDPNNAHLFYRVVCRPPPE